MEIGTNLYKTDIKAVHRIHIYMMCMCICTYIKINLCLKSTSKSVKWHNMKLNRLEIFNFDGGSAWQMEKTARIFFCHLAIRQIIFLFKIFNN